MQRSLALALWPLQNRDEIVRGVCVSEGVRVRGSASVRDGSCVCELAYLLARHYKQ